MLRLQGEFLTRWRNECTVIKVKTLADISDESLAEFARQMGCTSPNAVRLLREFGTNLWWAGMEWGKKLGSSGESVQ